jgi:hypothetical protein
VGERDAAVKEVCHLSSLIACLVFELVLVTVKSRRYAEDLAKTHKQLKARSQEAAMLASRPARTSSGTPGSVDIFQKAVQCSVCHVRLIAADEWMLP